MWFLKQMHNLVFRREASVFSQTCHILNLCVGVPALLGEKKENSLFGCLSASAACDRQLQCVLSGTRAGSLPLVVTLMLCLVAQHCTG